MRRRLPRWYIAYHCTKRLRVSLHIPGTSEILPKAEYFYDRLTNMSAEESRCKYAGREDIPELGTGVLEFFDAG